MSENQGRFVRPYAITGGRTSAEGPHLEVESQIVATQRGRANRHRYRWEAAGVIEACDSATALIEISAKLEVPIGVSRIVISDLIKQGAVELLEEEETASYTELLEKVLDGIRNL